MLITVDVGGLSDDTWRNVSQRIEKELRYSGRQRADHGHAHAFGAAARARISTRRSSSRRSRPRSRRGPPRIGYGTGQSFININRNIIDPEEEGRGGRGRTTRARRTRRSRSSPSKTTEGQPIAVYYNFAMHAVVLGQLDKVSGDVPGAASNYIEEAFDNKIVAVWSTGAAGDQNPIFFQQTYDLREIRVKDYATRGEDISNAMPSGGQGLNKQDPTVKRLMDQQKQLAASMGQFLGEEVLRVMRGNRPHVDGRSDLRQPEDRHLSGT